ncbi:12498_t:CDS:10 [Gigaspora margarita]|uniref:12498_t:CDS:1 n=1 Tax=Gigaspora margarita TaxID=4874 RepID=A0ABN7UPS3_GIGMA|nr:12498_t:CDS:10 [Gigaspora margarita]
MSLSVNFNKHSQALSSAYRDVRDGDIDKWVIYSYEKGGNNDLKVLKNGDGGLEELSEEFEDGKIQYAYVKVKDPNSELPKIVLIGWCGDGVPEAKKGLFNTHLNEVSDFLKGYHLKITARSEGDVDPSLIMKRLEQSGGSKYSININKNAPPPRPEPILPVRSVYEPVKIPNITELQKKAPRERIKPVRSVYEPIKVPNMNELRRSAAQEKVEPVKSSYQPIQVPDIAELQTSAPQEKFVPVRSVYEPTKVPNMNELRAQEKVEPVKSSYQPTQVPDIAELQKSAPQEKIEPRSTYKPEQPRKPKPINKDRLAFLNAGNETESPTSEFRREREERERAEREKAKREEQDRKRLDRENAEQKAEQEQLEWERAEQTRKAREERERLEKERIEKEKLRRQKEEEEELLRQEREVCGTTSSATIEQCPTIEQCREAKTASARVIYAYESAEDNEMSLIEGEIIVGITQVDDGWWQGESKDGSRIGLFPANYVELIESEIETETAGLSAKALYDYDAGEDNEISFKEDEIITEIEQVSEDWWQGTTSNGAVGLFPGN